MHRHTRRGGYVIIAVLIVVVVLSLAAYSFTTAMTAEHRAAVRTREVSQARLAAVSGVHYAMAALADPDTLTSLGDPTAAGAFHGDGEGITVAPDPNGRGNDTRFALVAVLPDGNGGFQQVRGAVVDEGGKLNVNALIQVDATGQLLYDALMKLPNMTAEVADAIVDWVDADDTARANGAESSYYQGLSPGYAAKNGPLNSLDELLLVRGVTPELLFGNDRNRNGIADDGDASALDRGWADYLTAYGRELNVDVTGVIREYVNNTELDQLPAMYQRLVARIGQEPADFLMAYRLFPSTTTAAAGAVSVTVNGSTGKATVTQSGSGGGPQQQNTRVATAGELSSAVQAALAADSIRLRGKRPQTFLELRNVQITLDKPADAAPNDPTPVYPSPLANPATLNSWLPVLLDKTTLTTRVELTPRLNVNTAPREVLKTIPGLAETDVNNIINQRGNLPAGDPATATGAWLVTSGAITPDVFLAIQTFVTGQSMVYRVQAIGFSRVPGPVARVEAVVDTNRGAPRILYFRDLTELGGIDAPKT